MTSDAQGVVGWTFFAIKAERLIPIYFTTSGNYSFDLTRDVPRQISGFIMNPTEVAKVDLSADEIACFENINGVNHANGVFRFTEVSHQKGVVKMPDGTTGDLTMVTLNDRLVELKRNTGAAHSLSAGADPAQAMRQILADANIPGGVAGAVSSLKDAVTWDGSVEDLSRFNALATLAGHRQPWSNNSGVIRSVASQIVQTDIIDLLDLRPTFGTIVVTDNYLTAPNRIIVTDNGSGALRIIGQWDAPGSAPNSFARRGYIQTQVVNEQGLSGNAHADEVAATLGEQTLTRQLNCQIAPTTVLDGPVVLSYDGSLWMLQSWSTGTGPGETMSMTATELT